MKIAFISCVKTKINKQAKAKDLYISDLFKKSIKYCQIKYDKIYILSAKYGVLDIEEIIEPYELTLNNFTEKEKKRWSYKVYKQIESKIGLNHEFYFHTGQNYRKYLVRVLKNSHIPLKGMTFGNQLKFYKKELL